MFYLGTNKKSKKNKGGDRSLPLLCVSLLDDYTHFHPHYDKLVNIN
ncbi:hypothetical protein PP187_gp261 [Klebsiella phage vB_KvM-Eowyn]|uniref:Uncharacterized protein n=1 Tax=Klebsiella phage vB_KvM-Eowyn TaxID=2762819 RepID=A0A7R8R563_9CAUD|nr:hypothetical protein PP187_gp261 [Klebsiella phage vB_KvM-Eowyn]CAD5236250.1 hypothetical protein LLCLJKAH_00261 [Klebsiella phage vB_KvM-Eowyn]